MRSGSAGQRDTVDLLQRGVALHGLDEPRFAQQAYDGERGAVSGLRHLAALKEEVHAFDPQAAGRSGVPATGSAVTTAAASPSLMM